MEQTNDTQEYILGYSLEEHEQAYATPGHVYLSIYKEQALVGFFILALETEHESVEFRRIVVQPGARGIGQAAIKLMEHHCRNTLGCHRIWLDVFEHNLRAKHIYEKLGYRRFDTQTHDAGVLAFYEKLFRPN